MTSTTSTAVRVDARARFATRKMPIPAATSSAPAATRSGEILPPSTLAIGLPGRCSLIRAQRWRSPSSLRAQISADPAAASATGQATASPNQMPAPRRKSMLPATMQATAAICRLRGRCRERVAGLAVSGSVLRAQSTR